MADPPQSLALPTPFIFYLWFSFPGTVQCRKIKYTNKTLNPSLYVARVKSYFSPLLLLAACCCCCCCRSFLIRTRQSLSFNIYTEESVGKFKAKKNPGVLRARGRSPPRRVRRGRGHPLPLGNVSLLEWWGLEHPLCLVSFPAERSLPRAVPPGVSWVFSRCRWRARRSARWWR